jgi:hypothetical protein
LAATTEEDAKTEIIVDRHEIDPNSIRPFVNGDYPQGGFRQKQFAHKRLAGVYHPD